MGTALSKNDQPESHRVVVAGRPNYNRCDNMIVTSKYTAWSFLPVVSTELFSRFAGHVHVGGRRLACPFPPGSKRT